MKKKIIFASSILFGSVLMLAIGFYASFYLMTGLEMNDRLKYEVAYLNGYVAVQKQLYDGDIKGAHKTLDFLIDSHAKTLHEFSFLAGESYVGNIIQDSLCNVVSLRKKTARVKEDNKELDDEYNKEIDEWYSTVDKYLIERGMKCEPYT